jgi:hypothetical protein
MAEDSENQNGVGAIAGDPASFAPRPVAIRLRRVLEHAPQLYLAVYARWRGDTFSAIQPDTALVISGFAGCGNSYLRSAFCAANPGVHAASHAHNWTELAIAVRRGLPSVLLVREPLPALASTLIRYAASSVAKAPYALEEYARLYERALPRRAGFVVADFAEATGNVGGIVERVNARFDSSFTPFPDGDPDAVRGVTQGMRDYDARVLGERSGLAGSLPSAERDRLRAAMIEQLQRPEYARLMNRCQAAYRAITGVGKSSARLSTQTDPLPASRSLDSLG